MTPRSARWIAWAIVGTFFILSGAGVTLQGLARTPFAQTTLPVIIFLVALVSVWIVIGALIVSRHPRHPVGWLLCAGMFFPAFDMLSAGYAAYDTFVSPGSLPGVDLALVWLKLANLGAHGLAVFTLIVLLFPDGRFPSPGWRKVAWTTVGTLLVFLPLQSVEPGFADPSFLPTRTNPLGVSASMWVILKPLMWTMFYILTLCFVAAFVSLIVRLRNARGDVRQQIKWLLFPVGLYEIFLLLFIIGMAKADEPFVGFSIAIGQIAIAGMVIATAFAIFKYRLYDVDLIINRTLVYGTLTACVVSLYVLVVGGAGLVFQTNLSLAALLITAVLTGVFYRPSRVFIQRGVDRLLPGVSGTPPIPPEDALAVQNVSTTGTKDVQTAARWMRLARAGWVVWAAIVWGFLILSVTAQISTITAEARGNLTAQAPAWLISGLVAQTISSLIPLILAGVLYLKRPNEGLVLLTSYFLLVNGVVFGPLTFLEPFWPGAQRLTYSVIQPLFYSPLLIAFLSVFPNGRFTPPWTRRLLAGAILYAPVGAFLFTTQANAKTTPMFILAVLASFALIFTGLYAQVVRYRRVSNTVEQQQTKWVILGFSVAAFLALVLTVLTIAFNYLSPRPLPWWSPLVNLGWYMAYAALPISLTFAVMRYRLFEIDIIINRTLVYGALTAGVVGLYALVVGSMGVLFQTQSNLLIALLATGLVAVLFQPLRERLQRGVNRLIYGERDDPAEALSRLGRSLESALPPDQVLPALVETIAQTLKLPFVGIAIQGQPVAVFGQQSVNPITFPLTFQGETTGELLAAPRHPDDSFTPVEMRLLQNLARQAGAAVRNAQLASDLQRSRQNLVTTREEERHRLRRDLHDGIGPTMAGLTLKLDAAKDLIAASLETGDPASLEEALQLLSELKSQTQETVRDIRHIVHDLRPPSLDVLGLAPALQVHFGQIAAPANLSIQLITNPKEFPRLSAAVEVAAYRIVLEAVTNVIQHAEARTCHVSLAVKNGLLQIEVTDDGTGLPEERNHGVGLNSMRERAEELGGRFELNSSQKGAFVRAEIPIPRGKQDTDFMG